MKKVFLFFAAVAALASCAKENPVIENPVSEPQEVTIEAVAATTKTQLVDGTNVQWTPGDKIKMCFDVKNWQNSCSWTGVEFENNGESVSESAFFTGSVDVNIAQDYGFVVYPTTFKFESRTGSNSANFTTTISHVLPSAQPAVENTFASDLNLSYAPVTKKQVTNNISYKNPIEVTFKNMCALIKVNLPAENYNVKEILVESASKGLTGEYSMLWEATSTKQTLKLNSFKSEVKEVAIANEDGSNLTPGASYYAVVWPGQHNGLTFTFTDEKGLVCVKNLNKTVNCEVGKITEINVKSLEFKEAEPELNVITTSMEFGAVSETKSLTFNTNKNWTITTDASTWIEVSPKSGEASKDAISVNVKCYENTQYQSRTGNITISAGGLTQTIKVTQAAAVKVVSLSVSTSNLSFTGPGSTSSFTITCNDNWEITEIPGWLTLSQTSGTESASAVTVNVTAKQCYIYNGRKGSFVISAGDQVKYINFNQAGPQSLSKGALISYASDLQDGRAYAIESYKNEGNYWNCTNVTDYPLAYSSLGSGVQVFRFAFVYHEDSSKGKSSDSNYNSTSTGTWELCSSGTYLGSDFKFNKKTIDDAMYIAHSNRWGNDTTNDIDMVKPNSTECIWYSNGYYWGGTGDGNRKWQIYEVNATY